jgi:hypothetical protein
MFGRILKILSGIVSVVPIVKDLWYMIKRDVPRVPCDICGGSGIKPGSGTPSVEKCTKCGGSGKIRETELGNNIYGTWQGQGIGKRQGGGYNGAAGPR